MLRARLVATSAPFVLHAGSQSARSSNAFTSKGQSAGSAAIEPSCRVRGGPQTRRQPAEDISMSADSKLLHMQTEPQQVARDERPQSGGPLSRADKTDRVAVAEQKELQRAAKQANADPGPPQTPRKILVSPLFFSPAKPRKPKQNLGGFIKVIPTLRSSFIR